MTRKDYELIAKVTDFVLRNTDEDFTEEKTGIKRLIATLSGKLKEENPRFDEARFFKACGIKY